MKRYFTLLVFIGVLIGTAKGQAYVYFKEPSVNLSKETVTSQGDNHYFYSQKVIWHDADGWELDLEDQVDKDFIVEVRTTGDIEILDGYYANKSGNNYEMGCQAKGTSNAAHKYDIHFKGNRGTIIVNVTNPNYQGSVYSGSYTINFEQSVTVKKWDFFSSPVNVDTYWWQTQNIGAGNEAITIYTWPHAFEREPDGTNNIPGVPEAMGLVFKANTNCFGIIKGDKPNRFVALYGGSELRIPNLQAGDRIKIKMGKHGGSMHLGISNASDALGKNITSEYVIGGCQWKEGKLNGEYHFQVNNNGTFQIHVNTNDWLYIYSIEVYRSDEMISENSVLGTSYMLLNQEGSNTPAKGTYNLHYYGKGERTRIDPNSITTTGTVTCNIFTTDGNQLHYTYTSTVGQYGSFRMRLDCYDHSGTYCTDYAWRTETVGYMQKLSYPYTWDFTDAYSYINSNDNRISVENQYAGGTVNDNKKDSGRNLWESETDGYGLRLSPDAAHNFLFCGGSQLWCGKEIIPELKGLAFTPVNYDGSYNGALTLTNEGMKINQNIRDWWLWRIMIPSVPTNGVIYVRAKEIRDDSFCNVGYFHGDATNKTNKSLFNANADGTTNVARKFATGDGDVIYVVPAPPSETNVTLFFTGVIVKKISVSIDKKTVNVKGYASESRNHAIDHALTSYFTGKEIKAYAVSSPDYKNRTLTLTDVGSSEDAHVLSANEGCVIFYTGESELSIFDGGFHFFVPDMHDEAELFSGNNLMVPNVGTEGLQLGMFDGDKTNYVLTYKYQKLTSDGTPYGEVDDQGPEMFYRVSKNGIKLHMNSAYLQLPTSEVKPKSTNEGGAAKFTFIFSDADDTDEDVVTALEKLENPTGVSEKAVWYNLNGQKLNGKPLQSGLYIMNGKKVLVK